MHIQPINDVKCVSSKGLYFAKFGVLFNKRAEFLKNSGVSVSETGVRYFEDTSIPQKIKEAVEKNKYIKNLADKYDTFVSYSCRISPFNKKWVAILQLSWADYSQKFASKRDVFSKLDSADKQSAEDSLLKNMAKNFVCK